MVTVNIHEAKTHLSRLVEQAAQGESFIIAKSGKPLVRVTALGPEAVKPTSRIGFLTGQGSVPDDFDQMASSEITGLFSGE